MWTLLSIIFVAMGYSFYLFLGLPSDLDKRRFFNLAIINFRFRSQAFCASKEMKILSLRFENLFPFPPDRIQ